MANRTATKYKDLLIKTQIELSETRRHYTENLGELVEMKTRLNLSGADLLDALHEIALYIELTNTIANNATKWARLVDALNMDVHHLEAIIMDLSITFHIREIKDELDLANELES